MKHITENRWIWYRTSDLALVYEQFYDGTQASYIKLFENGLRENTVLFTSDFRIPKCANPFLSMKFEEVRELNSAFSLASFNSTNSTRPFVPTHFHNVTLPTPPPVPTHIHQPAPPSQL